jgi:tRNA-splicing ligase RtcB
MDLNRLSKKSSTEWWLAPIGRMRVPGILFASEELVRAMDEKVLQQVANVAGLPGIVRASFAMPDAHWGYGFPIGGVAAFSAEAGGVISAGGVGFDISCGVRTLRTGLSIDEVEPRRAASGRRALPRGSLRGWQHRPCAIVRIRTRRSHAGRRALGGEAGFWSRGRSLETIEEDGVMAGADPDAVSSEAKQRQRDQLGTLGSGNHYLEVQEVVEIFAPEIAAAYQLRAGEVVLSIHCGSRGLGHQIGTDYLKSMLSEAGRHGIALPERELACAPINSATGPALPGSHARGHELRHGQPPGHCTLGARNPRPRSFLRPT